jgi:hypothetical protein
MVLLYLAISTDQFCRLGQDAFTKLNVTISAVDDLSVLNIID